MAHLSFSESVNSVNLTVFILFGKDFIDGLLKSPISALCAISEEYHHALA